MDVNFEILAEDARSLLASHKHYSNIETEDSNQSIHYELKIFRYIIYIF